MAQSRSIGLVRRDEHLQSREHRPQNMGGPAFAVLFVKGENRIIHHDESQATRVLFQEREIDARAIVSCRLAFAKYWPGT